MAELRVVPAQPSDYDRVLPLLHELDAPHVTDSHWRRIFSSRWSRPEIPCGYLLLQDSVVQGFLGAIFSTRTIHGAERHFCNMTSWVVRPEARGGSLQLLAPLLALKDHTLTNFTPSPTVARILLALRFTEIQGDQFGLFALPDLWARSKEWKFTADPVSIRAELGEVDRRIFDDHSEFECGQFLLRSGNESCFVVAKRVRRGRFSFARLHYVNNPDFFSRWIGRARVSVARAMGVAGLMVEQKYIAGRIPRLARRYSRDARWLVRLAGVNAEDVDTLYSELILLHA